jgi:hypothetical protein
MQWRAVGKIFCIDWPDGVIVFQADSGTTHCFTGQLFPLLSRCLSGECFDQNSIIGLFDAETDDDNASIDFDELVHLLANKELIELCH